MKVANVSDEFHPVDQVEANEAFVYVLACSDGSYYTGWTVDVIHRLAAHNGECPGGAKYTSGRRPVTLVWSKRCANKQEAQRLEYKIKHMTRTQKETFIQEKSV